MSDDKEWVPGLILVICIIFVFNGLAYSNWTQILGGLLSFCVFSLWYSGLIKTILTIKAKKSSKGEKQ